MKPNTAFTLIELLVVIAIIAILADSVNLGYLFKTKLIDAPSTYYDPGLRYKEITPVRFDIQVYQSTQYPWPKCDDQRDGVRGNYMYYPQSDLPVSGTHVSFSSTPEAFDPKLWDPGDDFATAQNPGDNPEKFRTIVSLLRT